MSDKDSLDRIKSLVIPPAWTDVRISPSERSHIQAVGKDSLGRLQYLYHEVFTKRSAKSKFGKLVDFARRLPTIRRAINSRLRLRHLSKEKVLALMVAIIESLYLRVGSKKSAEFYKTFGITTMLKKHVKIHSASRAVFSFVGKHHIRHDLELRGRKFVTPLKALLALKGPHLFQYVDDELEVRQISAADLNAFIARIAGKEAKAPKITAKDFRTWGGTVLAAKALDAVGVTKGERSVKRRIVTALRTVAEKLGNTLAVARSSYVHPKLIALYQRGKTLRNFKTRMKPGLAKEEAAVVAMLEK